MNKYRRIIPCLDVKDGRLVKGVHFVDLQDVGDPAEIGAKYSQEGADEIVFLDITATVEKRKTMVDVVRRTAKGIEVPLAVGGGISSLSIIDELINAGASKVSINTAAVKNPDFVIEAVKEFGSECVVIAIDTRKSDSLDSGFEVMIKGGREGVGIDAVEWAKRMEGSGAGEILPTSMDTDGVQQGYDIPMTKAIAEAVSIPVIASGGAGNLEHLYKAITEAKADAVLVASVFHFGKHTIAEAKEYLSRKGISVRM
ncbi:imidazole glycerol phosphate synthase subunit HisF [Candidatus Poribacteria bacterium]|nr:imidazole glycerol phosphate synthase subunit HisF [Candidatus Poribacteria bacterium]